VKDLLEKGTVFAGKWIVNQADIILHRLGSNLLQLGTIKEPTTSITNLHFALSILKPDLIPIADLINKL